MAEIQNCTKCETPLPADAPAGLCPSCLVRAGLGGDESMEWELDATASGASSGRFEPPPVEQIANRFPQLEILKLLGSGGMGAVYQARQVGLDRLVAVKVLPPEVGRDPSFAERFAREARAMARLNHPNIVAVHDFGQSDELFYFVMEYVDGANLRQTIRAGKLKPEQALAIVPQICEALQFAHEESVVHRDIKPENILIDQRGRVKIADFGLAKLVREAPQEATLTGTHQVMGTLHYMAPEQMRGSRQVDHRADIYSLGVVIYEMLTGELPIGRFAPPSSKARVDTRLDQVVLHALESEPERRYQHISEVKTDVDRISQFAPSAAPPIVYDGGGQANRAQVDGTRAQVDGANSRGSEGNVSGTQVLSVPFSITKHGVKAGAGVVRLDDAGLTFEFVVDERVREHNFFGEFEPGLKHVVLPLREVASIRLQGGMWASSRLIVRTHSLRPLADLVGSDHGQATLHIANGDLPTAWRVVEAVKRQLPDDAVVSTRSGELTDDVDDQRRLLQPPAVGLLIAGAANCLCIVPFIALLIWGMSTNSLQMFRRDEFSMAWLLVSALCGVVVVFAALKMRRQSSYWLSVTGAVLAIVPITPGALLGIPMGLWALAVLTRRGMASSFDSQQDQGPPAKLGPAERPQFSRKAIFGAMWAGLFFIALAFVFVSTTTLYSSTVIVEEHARSIESGPEVMGHAGGALRATPTAAVTTIFWILGAISLVALFAPFGTTILGIVSVSDIRRSDGRLTGLPLAVGDALLFPLLALDGLILAVAAVFLMVLSRFTGGMLNTWIALLFVLLLIVPVCLIVDVMIYRAVWRRAAPPAG